MIKRQYSDEFKEQILKECQETDIVVSPCIKHNFCGFNIIFRLIPSYDSIFRKLFNRQGSSDPYA